MDINYITLSIISSIENSLLITSKIRPKSSSFFKSHPNGAVYVSPDLQENEKTLKSL